MSETDQPPKWKTVKALTVDQRLCKASNEGEDALDKAWDRPYLEPDSAIEREEYFCNKLEEIRTNLIGLHIPPHLIRRIEVKMWNLIHQMRNSR